MNFYISDLHLGHANVIKHDNRPFETVQQMQDVIISNWNAVVKGNDVVYILGDFAWKSEYALDAFANLNGNLILVKGNHDKISIDYKKHFQDIVENAWVQDNGRDLFLCHYPIAHWRNQYYGSVHLYGHIHNSQDDVLFEQYKQMVRKAGIPCEAYNVGCMMPYMNYTPRTFMQIVMGYNSYVAKLNGN